MLPLVEPPRSQTVEILKKTWNFFSSDCNFASFEYFFDRLDVLESSNYVDYRNEENFFFHDFEKKNLVDEVWDIFEKVKIFIEKMIFFRKILDFFWKTFSKICLYVLVFGSIATV